MTPIQFFESDLQTYLDQFSALLIDTVSDGAAVGFLHPLSGAEARAFWTNAVAPGVSSGDRCLFGVIRDDRLAGTVQLISTLPPNQPHRAEIAKMMVHPSARRLGLGRALLRAALEHARGIGKTIVTLDTRTGDASQTLYASLGFEVAGKIPDFGLDPDGKRLHSTTYMFKRL